MKTHKQSQSARILAWLKRGRKLTSLKALKLFNCLNLKARIFELRQDYKVEKKMVKTESNKYVAEYYLNKAA